jgi:hypothetical protein
LDLYEMRCDQTDPVALPTLELQLLTADSAVPQV